MKLLCTTVFTLAITTAALADIINVPGDYPTIESAVIAANNGDTVLIAAGTYYESDIQLAEFDGTGGKDQGPVLDDADDDQQRDTGQRQGT